MRNFLRCGGGGRSRYSSLLVFAFSLVVLPGLAPGAVNSWINPASGPWEEPSSWSLGVLPDQTQSVYITNAGWKAVAIGPNTAQNFPQSMQIQDLVVASPTNSFNTLLLNFSGFEVPLQTGTIQIGANSAITVQSSALETAGLLVGGTFNQGDYSQVKVHGVMQIHNSKQFIYDVIPPGLYSLTNGTLSVAGGIYVGYGSVGDGKFLQYGGINEVARLVVSVNGEFDIHDGQLTATNGLLVGSGDYARSSSFYQYGGTVNADTTVNGLYFLHGGTRTGHFTAPVHEFQRVNASVLQSGGTNSADSMELGYANRFGGAIDYTLSNGVVQVDSSTAFGGGWFYQYGGRHTIGSNFAMQGDDSSLGYYSEYHLEGGTLSVGSNLTQYVATFTQNGGTNTIAGALVTEPTHPSKSTWFKMNGGTLNVNDISIGAWTSFQHNGGTIHHSGLLTMGQGTWVAVAADQTLGRLQLEVGPQLVNIPVPTNISAVTFPDGPSILRFANSSTQLWNPIAVLEVHNWHGSTNGGGATQLYFGSNTNGLTAQQLNHTQFVLSDGPHPAKILATGEIVPAPSASLDFTYNGNALTLTWPASWFLQSATNLTGPYVDVPGAASPWPVDIGKPYEFFRLRH